MVGRLDCGIVDHDHLSTGLVPGLAATRHEVGLCLGGEDSLLNH